MVVATVQSPSGPAIGGAGDGTAPIPEPAEAARMIEAAGAAPRPYDGATSASVTVHPETGAPTPSLLPVATVQTPPELSVAPGSGPSENGHASRLPVRIVVVLEDDRMTCQEIRRQLALRGDHVDEPQLALCLRAMTRAGHLTEKSILDRPCWATTKETRS
jgi:hypothetical protein